MPTSIDPSSTSNVNASTSANSADRKSVAKNLGGGGTSIGNKIGTFFRNLSSKTLHRHRAVSLQSMGKRTKIKSKEGKKILGQIQNNKLPMYEKLIALQTQTSKLPPREKEAIENEFIKQINQDRTLAREGSLGSIQDIINKPGIIVKSIRNDTIDRMVFFKTTKRFFGPGGPFPLESLSEDQKTDLLEALNQSEVVFIEDLSQLPGFWADIEGEEMRIEFEKKKVIEEAMSLM